MMKKLWLAVLGIILVAVLYYFNAQHIKNLNKLQDAVTTQLTEMQTQGFSVSERKIKKDTEHFVVTLDDPKKATLFFIQKGVQLKTEELEDFKGLQLAVDVAYVKNTITLELYPVVLPTNLKISMISENDKKIVAQLEEMIKNKTFLMHVDIEHSTTTFRGYIKDINEEVQGEQDIKLTLQGLRFSGDIKGERITELKQTLNTIHLYMSDEMNTSISGLRSNYVLTGPTVYDYTADYSIEKIQMNEDPQSALIADNLSLLSTSSVENGLASESLKAKIKNIDFIFGKEKTSMQTVFLDMDVSNLEVEVIEKLQNTDSTQMKEFDALLEKALSNTIHLEIPTLSVDKVTLQEKEMDGFTLHSILDIDPSLDIYRLGTNPKYALNKMDGNITLSLSKDLLDLMKKDPEAMLVYMMYRPKRVLNQRIYDLKLKNGLLNINGKDFKINGKPVKF